MLPTPKINVDSNALHLKVRKVRAVISFGSTGKLNIYLVDLSASEEGRKSYVIYSPAFEYFGKSTETVAFEYLTRDSRTVRIWLTYLYIQLFATVRPVRLVHDNVSFDALSLILPCTL